MDNYICIFTFDGGNGGHTYNDIYILERNESGYVISNDTNIKKKAILEFEY